MGATTSIIGEEKRFLRMCFVRFFPIFHQNIHNWVSGRNGGKSPSCTTSKEENAGAEIKD